MDRQLYEQTASLMKYISIGHFQEKNIAIYLSFGKLLKQVENVRHPDLKTSVFNLNYNFVLINIYCFVFVTLSFIYPLEINESKKDKNLARISGNLYAQN